MRAGISDSTEFVRAYHLTTAEHAIQSIGLRRLKVARISEVNDPFELFALDCLQRSLRTALKSFKATHDQRLGLLCFSSVWKNPVLWSHYAAGHRGICLGFDISRSLGVNGVQSVNYSDKKLRAVADSQNFEAIPDSLRELLFVTKFNHWSYEKEVRVLIELKTAVSERGLFFFPFGSHVILREVILGHSCPASMLEPVRSLTHATNAGAVVSKARLGFKYFEVKPDDRYPPC